MKISYSEMQNLFHAIRALDSASVSLDVKPRVALALNMKAIEPYVRALEKKSNDVMKAEGAVLDPTLNVRVEQAMRAELEAVEEIELRMVQAKDLALDRNKIGPEALRALFPILDGLEELA